jgi:hypothetical protein
MHAIYRGGDATMKVWRIEYQSRDGGLKGEDEHTFCNKVIAVQVAGEMNHHDPTFIYKVKPVERKRQERVRA